MELTYEDSQKVIDSRLLEYPRMRAVATAESFTEVLSKIFEAENLDYDLLPLVKNEILLVLSLYVPLSELAKNIQISTNLTEKSSEDVALLIETLILKPVHDELLAYDYLWNKQNSTGSQSLEKPTLPPVTWTQDPITKTPTAVPKIIPQPASTEPTFGAKPLTREEVLKALVPKRTMASDTASLNQQPKNTGTPQ